MSVFLITFLLDNLIKHYQVNEKEVWSNRNHLDKALSQICNEPNEYIDKEKLQECIQNIDKDFFKVFNDTPKNVKAYIYTLILKKIPY